MTKKEAVVLFKDVYPKGSFYTPSQHSSGVRSTLDKPMRDQAWNDFVNALQQNGEVSKKQSETWLSPWR